MRVCNIGGGVLCLDGGGGGGGSSGETKIAEGISDAKTRRSVLHIAFSGKVRGYSLPPPPPTGSASQVCRWNRANVS